MLSNLKNSVPLFFFCTVALTAMGANVHARSDLIHVLCQATPNQHLCESSLRSDPRSSTTDAKGLILIMVDVVKSKCSDSLRVVFEANVGVAVNAVNLGDPKFGEQAMIDSANEAKACERQSRGGLDLH
ncbi:hypothetical protein Ancab_012527 [Ancistrocladus abbreviatus]